MWMKILKYYVIVGLLALIWQMVSIARMVDLPKKDCEALGAKIVVHEHGQVCRYVRNNV